MPIYFINAMFIINDIIYSVIFYCRYFAIFVYNSIIFRGVTVGRGAVIKNCVLMQNTIIGANASMNCIITDKNVIIKDRRVLSGSENHPFYISKGTVI